MAVKTTTFVTDKRFVRRARELKTIRVMVEMYCRDHHGAPDPLCPRCAELITYAERRLERCVFDGRRAAPLLPEKPAKKARQAPAAGAAEAPDSNDR